MHANEVVWQEESGRTTWETLFGCRIVRKDTRKEMFSGL